MHELPDMTFDPVVSRDGCLCLQRGDAVVPLRLGHESVRTFVPGWRAVSAYSGFLPFSVLLFSNESGETAFWLVDATGLRLGGSLGELEPHALDALRVAAAPVVARLVSDVLAHPVVVLDTSVRAFLLLPEGLRRDIARLCAASAFPEPRRVLLDADPDPWEDDWSLSRRHVEALLATPFQDRVLMVAEDGMLSWPSPVDGRKLMVQGSLCSDDFRFAYRLVDAEHGLVCYPVVSHQHSATLGLYVPAFNLLVVRESGAIVWLDVYFPCMADWLVPLVCRFGAALEGYFQSGARRVASILRGWPSTHLGHQLWNELSGIDWFLGSARGQCLPNWIAPGPRTELWGPIDEIFPQLRGCIDRSAPNADFAIHKAYETGACLVRITSEYVSARLRASLRRTVEADPVYGEVQRTIADRRRPGAPVLLLGLRVENRTIVDLTDFCEELLEFVAHTFPGAIIVVDGHNSGSDGEVIVSHHELDARRSPLEVERKVVAHLRRLQIGRDVTVVDTLGLPVRTSLAWCEQADCFFSVWGASLAKYRWACNKPGLVITSEWNLRYRGDLHIYDSAMFMEGSSKLGFVDADAVKDAPDVPTLIEFGQEQPSYHNFDTTNSSIFLQLLHIDCLRTRLPAIKIGICAIFKNEARYLREWVLYHRLIGFDGFVLYDNGSTDRSVAILEELNSDATISIAPWPVRPGQQGAYRHFVQTFAERFDWVAFIDIDEFIHPLKGDDIRSCLAIAGRHSAILMNWLNFGPGSHVQRPIGLVTESYDLRLPEGDLWHRHVKSMVRVGDLVTCDLAHVAQLRGPVCNTRGETIRNEAIQPQVCHDNFVLNHYYTKSIEDWQEKVERGRVSTEDPATQRNQAQFDYCRLYSTVFDQRIKRFLPRLRAISDNVASDAQLSPGGK